MKKIKLLVFILFIGSIICACVTSKKNAGTNNTIASKNSSAKTLQAQPFEPFYVYEDFRSNKNHYAPSGWMGDISSLKLVLDCETNVYAGKCCIKMQYKPSEIRQWAGIYWQHPVNNWGDKKGGYNLVGASKITFWARGEEGNEVITEVKIGGISGDFSDTDVAWIKGIKLSRTWKQYSIDLSKSDLTCISGGFCIVFSKKDNPVGCTVYLDEIRYE